MKVKSHYNLFCITFLLVLSCDGYASWRFAQYVDDDPTASAQNVLGVDFERVREMFSHSPEIYYPATLFYAEELIAPACFEGWRFYGTSHMTPKPRDSNALCSIAFVDSVVAIRGTGEEFWLNNWSDFRDFGNLLIYNKMKIRDNNDAQEVFLAFADLFSDKFNEKIDLSSELSHQDYYIAIVGEQYPHQDKGMDMRTLALITDLEGNVKSFKLQHRKYPLVPNDSLSTFNEGEVTVTECNDFGALPNDDSWPLSPNEPPPPVTANETKQSNPWLYLGIALVLCIGIIAYFVRRKPK